jgi:hypothetical protein
MQTEQVKVYLSLPITGHDEKERRQTAARKSAELMFRHEDWQVVNPFHIYDRLRAELLAEGIFEEPSYDDILNADLKELESCHVAYFLKGWQASNGCKKEMQLCRDKGIQTIFE